MTSALAATLATVLAAAPAEAQRPTLGNAARPYVAIDTLVAITHVGVVDGTGAPARGDQTVLIQDDRIAAVGPATGTSAPAGALLIDGTGKTVIPGLVMVHEGKGSGRRRCTHPARGCLRLWQQQIGGDSTAFHWTCSAPGLASRGPSFYRLTCFGIPVG